MLFDVLLKSVQFRFKITAYRLLKNLYGLRLVLAVYRVLVLYSPFYLFIFLDFLHSTLTNSLR